MRNFNAACARFAAFIDPWFPATIPSGFVAVIPLGIYVGGRLIMGHFIEYFQPVVHWADVAVGIAILVVIFMYLRGHKLNRDAKARWDQATKNNHPKIPTRRPPI